MTAPLPSPSLLPLPAAGLAQAGPPGAGQDLGSFVVWILVLIVAAIVAGVVLMLVRRRLLSPGPDAGGEGLMDSLRRARDAGEMTPEEYDAARRAIAARVAGRSAVKPAGDQNRRPA